MTFDPTLYCIMREDVPDMNPGKLAAQAMHVQATFEHDLVDMRQNSLNGDRDRDIVKKLVDAHRDWTFDRVNKTYMTCGRTVVLQADMDTIQRVLDRAVEFFHTGILTNTYTDPTYPYQNFYGKIFTMPYLTGMYVFAAESADATVMELLKSLPLHP